MGVAQVTQSPGLKLARLVQSGRRLTWRWPLLRLLAQRLAALVLLLVGISLVSFVLTNLVPGDPVTANLGSAAASSPEAVEQYRERYGLDKPLPVQYATYLWGLLHGDLGASINTSNPVSQDLATFIPATAELAILSVMIGVLIGVPLGTFAALHRNRAIDHVFRMTSLLGISVPTFWLALVSIHIFAGLPTGGRLPPGDIPPPHVTGMYSVDAALAGQWSKLLAVLDHLALPALVLAASSIAILTRFTRSAVLEVIEKDYIRAARAKGLNERKVVMGHVLRAAFLSVLTVIGLVFAHVLTGAILVEYMFGYPGMGQYAYTAATTLDLPAIAAVSMFVALVYVTINFVVDVLYGVIDPRLRAK